MSEGKVKREGQGQGRREGQGQEAWDDERRRRMNYKRRQWAKEHLEIAILVALAVGFVVFMYFWNKYQPLRERAAYIEGYYGVDHQTALAMAESETTNH